MGTQPILIEMKRNARIKRQMAREIAARFRAQARASRRARCRQRKPKHARLLAAMLADLRSERAVLRAELGGANRSAHPRRNRPGTTRTLRGAASHTAAAETTQPAIASANAER